MDGIQLTKRNPKKTAKCTEPISSLAANCDTIFLSLTLSALPLSLYRSDDNTFNPLSEQELPLKKGSLSPTTTRSSVNSIHSPLALKSLVEKPLVPELAGMLY